MTTPAESNLANDSSTDIGNVQGFSVDYSMDKQVIGTGGAPQAGQARFSLKVKNEGFGIGDNGVTVTDLLPAGLTYASATGDGWTCASGDPAEVVCTHEGNVHAGSELPAITVTANVAADATSPVTNRAIVESDDDITGGNDEDTADLEIRPPTADFEIKKSHSGANVTVGSERDLHADRAQRRRRAVARDDHGRRRAAGRAAGAVDRGRGLDLRARDADLHT